MATRIMLKHPQTGVVTRGYYGFSWTTLFFGGLPALFRGDWILGLVLIVLQFLTWGVSGIIAAFVYNKYFTIKLIERGYQLADSDAANTEARSRLCIASPQPSLAG
jgi:hypothetical protein